MDRAQKEQVVEELGQIFESSGVVVVARYEGMTVAEMQALRAQMREAGGAVRVAKNRLAKIALEGSPAASIASYLTGMTVLAFSDDPRRAYAEAKGRVKRGNRVWQIGFGSGFKCNSAVWRALRDVPAVSPAAATAAPGAQSCNPWVDCVAKYPPKAYV